MKQKKQKSHFFLSALIIFFLDQLTKIIIRRNLPLNEKLDALPFLSITHVSNTGAGFSILQGYNVLLIWISIFAVGMLVYFFDEFQGRDSIFMGIVLGGIFGNLIDRLAFGGATDFIDLHFWPIFNIADSALSIGIILYVISNIRKEF